MPFDLKPSSSVVADLVPGIAVAGSLVALVVWDPKLVGTLVREGQLVEWLQVALALVALGFVLASAVRRFSPADVLFAALLTALAAFEVDLDQRVFGIPVVGPRFVRATAVPWPLKALAGAVIVGVPLALLAYALHRRRALWREVHDGRRQRWLQLLVAGFVLFGAPQLLERQLNSVLPLPDYFLEESLELLGTTYLALGTARR